MKQPRQRSASARYVDTDQAVDLAALRGNLTLPKTPPMPVLVRIGRGRALDSVHSGDSAQLRIRRLVGSGAELQRGF
jgi:hypothetical protein